MDTAQGTVKQEPRFVTPITAEFFRKAEITNGLMIIKKIRQEFNISKDKNIGFARFEINGESWLRIGHSGKKVKDGTAPMPKIRYFETLTEKFDRAADSEVKILEEFAAKYANRPNVKGIIYLFTERPPCGSCTNVVKQFREMFPNVRIEVASGDFIVKN